MASKKSRKRRFTEPKKQLRKRKLPEANQEKQNKKYNRLRDWFKSCMPELNNTSYPNEGEPELCKERVKNGMECWCRDRCSCRTCQKTSGDNCKEAQHECPDACKKCSEYLPCY